MTPTVPPRRTLYGMFPRYSGERVNLDVLGQPPTAMETAAMLAPLAGATVFAPTMPAALAGVPLYHLMTSGRLRDLPSIPTMPGEPWSTLADLFSGAGGRSEGGDSLAAVRYKRPGVSAAARETAESYHRAPYSDPIEAKNLLFHATEPMSVDEILRAGEIVPDPLLQYRLGAATWENARRMSPPGKLMSGEPGPRGVSVSRVPRVASKGSKAVSFVLDPKKMPATRPLAEQGYGKVQGTYVPEWAGFSPPARMNPRFEFEERTFDKSIPREAIREIWIDKDALENSWSTDRFGASISPEDMLDTLRYWADEYGLPVREFPSGYEMHRGRVKR